MNALRDNGLDENTLVMFSNDNGPWYQGSRGGLRGRKGETMEGGMRVPMVARFPGQIPAGLVTNGVATSMDILPTLARLAGGAMLPGKPLDGMDIWPLFTGELPQMERYPFLFFEGWHVQCARLGRWKLHMTRYSRQAWNPDPPGGRTNLPLPRQELYDMATDPGENYDVSLDNPEVVADIRRRVEDMIVTFPEPVGTLWRDTMRRQVEYTPPGALPVERRP
jgi:arylsulfatase A-like enzyme